MVSLSLVPIKNVAYKFSEDKKLLRYNITPGNTDKPTEVCVTSDMFSDNKVFYVVNDCDLEVERYSFSLGEMLSVPSTKGEATSILNAQMNTFLGIGHVRALELFDKFSSNHVSVGSKAVDIINSVHLIFKCAMCSSIGARDKDKKKVSFRMREMLLRQLIDLAASNGWYLGSHIAEQGGFIVCYFDIPGFEQLSVATNKMPSNNKLYQGKWDGHRHSTLPKIERGLFKNGLHKELGL